VLDKIGPVKNPLTIIAIFAGIVEVSSTLVLPRISSDLQGTYIWFLMLFPSCLVAVFFGILIFNPIVLYAPSDYDDPTAFERMNKDKRLVEDYEESKFLSFSEPFAESVITAVKENVQNTDNDNISSTNGINKEAEELANQINEITDLVSDKLNDYTSSYDNEYSQARYAVEAYSFEHQIFNILNDLGISSSFSSKNGCMDIIARKKNGKIIPIEVKFYKAPLRGGSIAQRLVYNISKCMDGLSTNEAILIISSSISGKAMKIMETSFPGKKLNIVTGNTEDALIPQLKKIFDIK
jgi:hypothetical protein